MSKAKLPRLPDPEMCLECKLRGRVVKSIKVRGRRCTYRLRRYECRRCRGRWNGYLSRINPARVRVSSGLD